MSARHFLFLQGPTSPFFSKLGTRLIDNGHSVSRINFNAGDFVYWGTKPSWQFRESANTLPTYLEKLALEHKITDFIMLGDTRPVNAPARKVADKLNIRCHIFEEGYLRPNYLTLEEDGINGYSPMPKSAKWYRSAAQAIEEPNDTTPVSNPMRLLALHEIGYHLPNLLNPIFYPGYKTHRPYISGLELAGWGIRFAKMPWYESQDKRVIQRLLKDETPFYLLPLQLDSDSQIQTHSPFNSMLEVIERTLKSFAQHAPQNSQLVIKNHPLDTGFTPFRKYISTFARSLSIQARVLYLESGNLVHLLNKTEGVVTVNSTVGLTAIEHQCKTITLSDPLYNIEQLTYQGSLDSFWHADFKPDMLLYTCFRKVLTHCALINGGFYSQEGIAIGVESAIQRFHMPESPLETLCKRVPVS